MKKIYNRFLAIAFQAKQPNNIAKSLKRDEREMVSHRANRVNRVKAIKTSVGSVASARNNHSATSSISLIVFPYLKENIS